MKSKRALVTNHRTGQDPSESESKSDGGANRSNPATSISCSSVQPFAKSIDSGRPDRTVGIIGGIQVCIQFRLSCYYWRYVQAGPLLLLFLFELNRRDEEGRSLLVVERCEQPAAAAPPFGCSYLQYTMIPLNLQRLAPCLQFVTTAT